MKKFAFNKVRISRNQLRMQETKTFYAIMSVGLVMFVLARLYPLIWGIQKSFTNYTGFNIDRLKDVGFDNYKRVFSDSEAMSSLFRTFGIGLIVVPLTLIICNVLALLLTSFDKGVGVYRTIYYLPSIVPQIAAVTMWQGILMKNGGLINTVMEKMGITPVNWLGYDYVLGSLCMLMIWGAGAGTLNNIAAIKAIPQELFEAAEIDGASRLKVITKIILPLIANMNFLNLITGIIATLQLFSQPVLLSGSGLTSVPLRPIYTYLVHVYQQIFVNLRFGYGLALTWIVFTIIVISTLLTEFINNRNSERKSR